MSEAVPGDKVLLYDHGGHNFTYELARDLSAQGTPMVYAYTAGVTAPHGRLVSEGSLQVEPLGKGRTFERYKLPQRVWGEIRLGFESMRLARRTKSRHVITCNMPVIIVALLAAYCWVTRRRFTVWFQDSQAGIAAAMLDSGFALKLIRMLEGWGLRRAERVIAISPAMVNEAKRMGVKDDRIALLPNWAPISQIPVMDKVNDWSVAHGLNETFVFLYSGTLGLKHSPDRLTALARWIKDEGHDALVLVVSEGPVAESLAEEAKRDDLPLQVKPFQPAEVLPQVLATADVCIVLLEAHASEFSVPSKVWSYMCAGRPILGSMPLENEAAKVIADEAKCGVVVEPTAPAETFVGTAAGIWTDGSLRSRCGESGRVFADAAFEQRAVCEQFAENAGITGPIIDADFAIIEWRHGGHRLAYVAAIADGAKDANLTSLLVTSRACTESEEFATHIAPRLADNRLVLRTEESLGEVVGTLAALLALRRRGLPAVIPEADRLLFLLLLAKILRVSPKPINLILMRPPRAPSFADPKSLVVGVAKVVLTSALAAFRGSTRVLLLEDPLASEADRVWRHPMTRLGDRLNDPQDLVAAEPTAIPELAGLEPRTPIVAVVGSIDSRKRLGEIVEAWRQHGCEQGNLVIAGRFASSEREWFEQQRQGLERTVAIDRYLSDGELCTLLGTADGVFVLYDGGLSSGILGAAAAHGCWVIHYGGTRTGRVAQSVGIGISSGPGADHLAQAIDQALSAASRPRVSMRSTRVDFARQIVSALVPFEMIAEA